MFSRFLFLFTVLLFIHHFQQHMTSSFFLFLNKCEKYGEKYEEKAKATLYVCMFLFHNA